LRAADGKITSFDVPGAGPAGTIPTSINARGEITGFYYDAGFLVHGFVRAADGTFTTFDGPLPNSTQPISISENGQITGSYVAPTNGFSFESGFVRARDGTITIFDAPGAGRAFTGTFPQSISPDGVITGGYIGSPILGAPQAGFVRAPDGTITTFNGPAAGIAPSTATSPQSINPSGEITGWYADGNGVQGFVRASDGTITSFDAGPQGTNPTSINPSGEVTGWYADGNGVHGFVRASDGTITSFDVGPHYTFPVSINPRGEIAGWYYDAGFLIHSFLRKPDREGSKQESDDGQ
jgi:hypothetical protein